MPEDAADLTRRMLEAFNARDRDAILALMHPQVEVHTPLAGLGEMAIFRGHDGVRDWQADLDESWEKIRFENQAMFVAGGRTLTYEAVSARGRLSGAETVTPFAAVWSWREGLCSSLKVFRDRAAAIAELGVSEGELTAVIAPGQSAADLVIEDRGRP